MFLNFNVRNVGDLQLKLWGDGIMKNAKDLIFKMANGFLGGLGLPGLPRDTLKVLRGSRKTFIPLLVVLAFLLGFGVKFWLTHQNAPTTSNSINTVGDCSAAVIGSGNSISANCGNQGDHK